MWLNLHSFPRRQLPLKSLSHIFARLPLPAPGPLELDCPPFLEPELDESDLEPDRLSPLETDRPLLLESRAEAAEFESEPDRLPPL